MSASAPSAAARTAARRHRDRAARRVRKALAPTRAGLGPVLDRLEPEEGARLAALHETWLARTLPADAAERAALDELVLATARRERLARLELRALEAAERAPGLLPDREALATLRQLARLRGRLARDLERAREELAELRACRPALPVEAASPAQLLWLAERILDGRVEAPPAPEALAARLLWQAERRPARLRRPAPEPESIAPDAAASPAGEARRPSDAAHEAPELASEPGRPSVAGPAAGPESVGPDVARARGDAVAASGAPEVSSAAPAAVHAAPEPRPDRARAGAATAGPPPRTGRHLARAGSRWRRSRPGRAARDGAPAGGSGRRRAAQPGASRARVRPIASRRFWRVSRSSEANGRLTKILMRFSR